MQIPIPNLDYLLQPLYLGYFAVAVALLFLFWISIYYRRTHRPIIPFASVGGTIEIAPSTLRSIIQHAALSVNGVVKVASQHAAKRKGISVRVAIHMRANAKLQVVEMKLKQRIKAALLEQFGMEIVDPIHIKVTKIIGEPLTPLDDSEDFDNDSDNEFSAEKEYDSKTESDDDRPFAEDTKI
jgi:uncharacterized alkaline shock family protein YloU